MGKCVMTLGICGIVVSAALLLPTTAFAQAAIAGVVRDASGGVLPGVTVEAASPALIEKVRTVTTDSEGLYKVVDLRPGSYSVTFTLTGFTAIKRDGIELVGAFTATVNAELQVGDLQETLTVSGQAPTIDVSSVVQEQVLQRAVIDALPTGNRSFQQLGQLIPQVVSNVQSVGGVSIVTDVLSAHDSRPNEMALLIDGMSYHHGGGVGGNTTGILMNDGTVQELSIESGSLSAENEYSGVRTNVIPREGGNAFRGIVVGAYSGKSLQGDNITPELKAQGTTVNGLAKTWDINPAIGGAILKDRLWFWAAFRAWGINQYTAGLYYAVEPTANLFTPDLSRPAISLTSLGSENARLTWQPTPRNKFAAYYDIQQHCECTRYKIGTTTYPPTAPEAIPSTTWNPNYMAQGKWTSTISNRLLAEAGGTFHNFNFPIVPQSDTPDSLVPIRDLTRNLDYRNVYGVWGNNASHQYNYHASLSYVTGSHAIKVGFQNSPSSDYVSQNHVAGNYSLQTLNDVPVNVVEYATPLAFHENLNTNLGIYAQDQWKVKRVTLNVGARFDHWNASIPAQTLGPGLLVPNRNIQFEAVPDVPNWTNVTPRLGAAWDVFGDGKTAVKGFVGKYLYGAQLTTFTRIANPIASTVSSATRPILNGSFTPDCDFANILANGDCGQLNNTNFGSTRVVTRYDPSVTSGNRGGNWEVSGSLQQELFSGLSLSGTYFRRWYTNLTYTQNQAVTAADYDSYCITAPLDSRLPGGGGNQICGLYDIKPSSGLFGQTNNLIMLAPDQTEVHNAVDLSVNARLPHGVVLSTGTSTGRTEINQCFMLGHPEDLLVGSAAGVQVPLTEDYCDNQPPFQTQVKTYAVVPLPLWGLRTSATYKHIPGPSIAAAQPITTAAIAATSTLGRRLAGSASTVTVDLVPPGTLFAPALNQVDFRITKEIVLARTRLRANFDVYNAFNASSVLLLTNTYGPSWQNATAVLSARLLKFSAQLDF